MMRGLIWLAVPESTRENRKFNETLRILQEASVGRQQRQSRQQQNQAALESQPAGSSRRDWRQRATSSRLHAMYPQRQGEEKRLTPARICNLANRSNLTPNTSP